MQNSPIHRALNTIKCPTPTEQLTIRRGVVATVAVAGVAGVEGIVELEENVGIDAVDGAELWGSYPERG